VTCTFHCSECQAHFHSLEAFDLHRAGDHASGRVCLEPDECDRLVVATADGACRLTRGVAELCPVVIYRSRRHAEDEDALAERQAEGTRGDLDHSAPATGRARALAGVGS
jgi:hypothetical protein